MPTMRFPSKEELSVARSMYRKGTRVELVHFEDEPYSTLRPGDTGTVESVDDGGNIHIRWDNGSSLAAIYGVDSLKVVKAAD